MERRRVIICSVGFILGLIAVVLGLAADASSIKDSQVTKISPGVCSHLRSAAYSLGVIAACSLLVAHIIINYECGCIWWRYPDSVTMIEIGMSYLTWLAFIVPFVLLLRFSFFNDQHDAESVYFNSCYVVINGFFTKAAMVGLLSILSSIVHGIIDSFFECPQLGSCRFKSE